MVLCTYLITKQLVRLIALVSKLEFIKYVVSIILCLPFKNYRIQNETNKLELYMSLSSTLLFLISLIMSL